MAGDVQESRWWMVCWTTRASVEDEMRRLTRQRIVRKKSSFRGQEVPQEGLPVQEQLRVAGEGTLLRRPRR